MQRGRGGPQTGAAELCARRRKRRCSLLWAHANPDAPPARGQQGRELLEQRDCLSLNTPPTAVGPVLGPASQAQRAVPGAPEWRSPHRELSGTPAPDACRHTSRRPTRPARTSCVAARLVQSWRALLLRLLHRRGKRRALLLRLRLLLGERERWPVHPPAPTSRSRTGG
jgi:hypothetical protein